MFIIKDASLADIPVIRQMAKIAFPATYRNILTAEQTAYMMEMMYSEKSISREMSDGQRYRLGYLDGKPCAYTETERQSTTLFHLQKIYVLPECQGRGIGEKMFADAVSQIRKRTTLPSTMELNVNRKNTAVRFYEKMGMKQIRSGDFDIGGGFFMNDYIMALAIPRL